MLVFCWCGKIALKNNGLISHARSLREVDSPSRRATNTVCIEHVKSVPIMGVGNERGVHLLALGALLE